MSRNDANKGREKKKPKQVGVKNSHPSAYQAAKTAATPAPFKIRSK